MGAATRNPAISAAFAALFILTACTSGGDETSRSEEVTANGIPIAKNRPNVIIFLTDDQRASSMPSLPKTLDLFKGGTRYTNAYATSPVCCPSRASIMSGLYAHNHRVITNGKAGIFAQKESLQWYLKDQGYYTGIAGKFLNLWDVNRAPSYFDKWAVMEDDYDHIYYDFMANVEGRVKKIDKYSTTWIGDRAQGWLKEFEKDDDKPWYLYLAPYAPHPPSTPEPKYANSPVSLYRGNPAVGEQDRTDKAPAVRAEVTSLEKARAIRAEQLRVLPSIDDMVSDVFSTMKRLDEDRDTLAIFMSDNGYIWGEHSLRSKRWPYMDSIKIPLLVRWPSGAETPASDRRIVANIDVLPTILDTLGIWSDSGFEVDGKPITGSEKRDRLLLEYWFYKFGAPTWAATLTKDSHFIEYYDAAGDVVWQEFYDLKQDPYELDSLLVDGDKKNDANLKKLSRRLAEDRSCEIGRCP
jgi:arylsulfatase A-like enzyme